jgi:hypothetical protein
MLLQRTFMALLALATGLGGAIAAPFESTTYDVNGAPLEFGESKWSNGLSVRAPSHDCRWEGLECNHGNLASVVACEVLWEQLDHGGFAREAMDGDRYACVDLDGEKCCTTWNDARPTFKGRALADGVRHMLNNARCEGNRISSRLHGVKLGGDDIRGCVTQCLSNREKGC